MKIVILTVMLACAGIGVSGDANALVTMTEKEVQALTQQGVNDPWDCRPSPITKETREVEKREESAQTCWQCREGERCLSPDATPVAPKSPQKSIPRIWLEDGI